MVSWAFEVVMQALEVPDPVMRQVGRGGLRPRALTTPTVVRDRVTGLEVIRNHPLLLLYPETLVVPTAGSTVRGLCSSCTLKP